MKKILFVAGVSSLMIACNDHAGHNNSLTDTSANEHASHTQPENKNDTNAITSSMDQMMKNMHSMKPTGNIDIDYAKMMIEHHKGAVDMARVAIAKGSDAEIRTFSEKVISVQNSEISMMESVISKSSGAKSPQSDNFQKALSVSMSAMMDHSTPVYHNIDKDFAAQMIPHHQSAVDMAKAYIEYGKDATLIKLSQGIISSQSEEIKWLRNWLNKE